MTRASVSAENVSAETTSTASTSAVSASNKRALALLGAVAFVSYLVHNGNHVLRGEPYDLMWFCNVSPLLLAIGCVWRKPLAVSVSLLWLLYGTPMWFLDLMTGAGMILTSFLPHVVCVAVGVLAVRRLGFPKHSWLWASGGSVLLLALTRLVTPAEYNVNLVFSVWAGWEQYFPTARRLPSLVGRLQRGSVSHRRDFLVTPYQANACGSSIMTKTPFIETSADVHPATARYAEHINPAFVKLLGTFGYGRVFERARGCELWDAKGRSYLDMLAGFGTNSLGHNPPRIVQAMQQALADDMANVMHVGPQAWADVLGELLAERVPKLPLSLLSLSGGEAVEAAMKLARAATGRPGIIYTTGGYHGTGLGNLSVMGHARWQRPFQPLVPECYATPFGDLDALETLLKGHRIGAFLVEPIQGEAGVIMPDRDYLFGAQQLCQKHGALFMVDEVQTGLARTGKFLAYQHDERLDPDVVILGKALGAGMMPVSATLTRRALHQAAYGTMWKFDLHGSTYGGNALGCRAAIEAVKMIEEDDLAAHAKARGDQLLKGLVSRIGEHPLVKDVRGRGLMVAVELGPTGTGALQKLIPGLVSLVSKQVFGQWLSLRLLERGIVCQPASQQWDVLKLTPPLTIREAQVDHFVDEIAAVLNSYRSLVPLCADVSKRIGNQAISGWGFG